MNRILYDLPITSVELNTATYPIPAGTSHPEFVVPLEVTDFIIRRYGLADPGRRVIDPFAGNGDFIQRILSKGGQCDGIELDQQQYELARHRIDLYSSVGNLFSMGEMKLGDCTATTTAIMRLGYHAMYTSMPFTLVRELAKPDYYRRDKRFARTFNLMLHSESNVLIVDSADQAKRNGQALTPALDTIEYLVNPSASYSYGYFNLVGSHKFTVKNPPPGCDGQFTELVFVKRWPYYLGALADIAMLQTVRRKL